jgi:hypothetical protein
MPQASTAALAAATAESKSRPSMWTYRVRRAGDGRDDLDRGPASGAGRSVPDARAGMLVAIPERRQPVVSALDSEIAPWVKSSVSPLSTGLRRSSTGGENLAAFDRLRVEDEVGEGAQAAAVDRGSA